MLGVLDGNAVGEVRQIPNEPFQELERAIVELTGPRPGCAAALASVNQPISDRIRSLLQEMGVEVYRPGADLPLDLRHTLEDDSTLGQDRILNAIGAFAKSRQACIVIDAGTAVTVDFVDGEGVFHGGAIAPGLRMMLRALHEQTAALPAVDFAPPDPAAGPFGKDTPRAMLVGVAAAVKGLVHFLIDRYAEFYEAYPRVIATGGDARVLFGEDELIEIIVPELPLLGLAEVCRRASSDETADADGG